MASQPQNASYLRGASDKGPVLEPISIVAIWRSSIQEDFYGRNPMWRQERFLSIFTDIGKMFGRLLDFKQGLPVP